MDNEEGNQGNQGRTGWFSNKLGNPLFKGIKNKDEDFIKKCHVNNHNNDQESETNKPAKENELKINSNSSLEKALEKAKRRAMQALEDQRVGKKTNDIKDEQKIYPNSFNNSLNKPTIKANKDHNIEKVKDLYISEIFDRPKTKSKQNEISSNENNHNSGVVDKRKHFNESSSVDLNEENTWVQEREKRLIIAQAQGELKAQKKSAQTEEARKNAEKRQLEIQNKINETLRKVAEGNSPQKKTKTIKPCKVFPNGEVKGQLQLNGQIQENDNDNSQRNENNSQTNVPGRETINFTGNIPEKKPKKPRLGYISNVNNVANILLSLKNERDRPPNCVNSI